MLVRFAAAVLSTAPAFGQAVTVQQPTFESFSVGTTVSVPDRGTIGLGGVGRAAGSRSRFGYARGASASSTSASVFIHDFEAMDAAVLNAADGAAPRPAFTKSRYSDATSYGMSRRYAILAKGEHRSSDGLEPRDTVVRAETPLATARPSAADNVDRLFGLGVAAERRGDLGVAAIHFRVAAKRGSTEAARRLDALKTAAVADKWP